MDTKKIIFGEYDFCIQGRPASLQSSGTIKEEYKKRIKEEIKDCSNIFIREIGVIIEWYTDCDERYKADSSYDVDNIIKPTLDAMTGCDGLFIDDCQVQNVECRWIDKKTGTEDSIHIRVFSLERNDDYVLEKENICFFQQDGPIYYVVPTKNKALAQAIYDVCSFIFCSVESLKEQYAGQECCEQIVRDFEMSALPMVAIRYHITRINKSGFKCIKRDDIKKFIDSIDSDDSK